MGINHDDFPLKVAESLADLSQGDLQPLGLGHVMAGEELVDRPVGSHKRQTLS